MAGIEAEEKLEEKELKEGGGEDRVDSSESDEPKVEFNKNGKRFILDLTPVHIRWVLAWSSSPERARRVSA